VQRVCLEGLARGLFGNSLQGAGAVEINEDGATDDGEGPPGEFNLVTGANPHAIGGFPDDPAGGEKQQGRLDKGGNALDLGVAIMMLVVGRLIAPANGEIGDDGGAEINEAMNGF